MVMLGLYGRNYDASSFIYAGFQGESIISLQFKNCYRPFGMSHGILAV